jgi:hypothetical protein
MPPTTRTADSPSAFADKFGWGAIVKLLLAAAVSCFTAYATITAVNAQQNEQLALLKSRQDQIVEQIVPRTEHEAHWKAEDERSKEMLEDVREIRRYLYAHVK